ncbi:hypothetical protein HDU78_011689, partial [Chytriomyces hyalinus]
MSAKSVLESNEFKSKISELEANLVNAREDAEWLRKAAQSQSSTMIQSADEEVEGLKNRIADLELLRIAARDALAGPSNEKDVNDTATHAKRRISELEYFSCASVASAELVSAKDLLVNDKCVLTTTTRCHAAEQNLALEKQALLSRETELTKTKSRLAEEEEKKNKSIQLLRNMKAKILKLENTLPRKKLN